MIETAIAIVLWLNTIRCENKMEPFIVGGSYSEILHFPHSVYLAITCKYNELRSIFTCGASILNQSTLLTAAHCVYRCTDFISILMLFGHENTARSKKMLALEYKSHEKYSETDPARNDIALVKTQQPFELGANASRIAICKNPPYTELAMVAGWGYIDEIRGIETNQLKHITQKIINREQCQKVLGLALPNGIICGGVKKDKSYTAKGDSGGALIVRGYIQVGIVSCKLLEVSRSVAIYTDVGYFYNWITKQAHKFHCNN